MTGSSSRIWKFVRVFAGVASAALFAIPLCATPIATGPDGLNVFAPGSLTFEVVMNPGGTQPKSQGFAGLPTPATFTSTIAGSMTLDNILGAGYTVNSATLDMTVFSTLTAGSVGGYGCSPAATGGTENCYSYMQGTPVITVGASPATYTTVTVASTSGTTYTWNYQVTSDSPFQLNLATADPDFLTDLSNGQDLSINWTQTIQLSGSYTNPAIPGHDKCKNCKLTFQYNGLSRSTVVNASVNGSISGTEPPDPPEPPTSVPEPSTGVLLGLGIIGTAATLRRKLFPR